jgi:hypothetical protein
MDYITALEDALGKKQRKTCCLSSQAMLETSADTKAV